MIPNKLKAFWNLLTLPCQGMNLLASESLDRDLRPLERYALGLHQFYCRGCHRYGKQLRFLRIATCKLNHAMDADAPSPLVSLAPGLPEADRSRIKKAIRDHQSHHDSETAHESD